MAKYPIYPTSEHYDSQRQRFYNTPATQPIQQSLLPTLWKMMIHHRQFMPKQALPQHQPDWQYFLSDSTQAKIIWFGHSSFMLHMNGYNLLIDPVFAKSVSPVGLMMYRFQNVVVPMTNFPQIDYILISHNHYDHLDKHVIQYFSQKETQFIVPLGVEVLLKDWGINPSRIQCLDWWQTIQLQDLSITATPARHNTARGFNDQDKTLWQGYVFENQNEKIYYSGDTSYGDGRHFKAIGQHWQGFDLALIENGQYNVLWPDNHLFPEQTIQAVQDVQAKCFMPVHWGAYALSTHTWQEPVQRSIHLAHQANIKTLTPHLGEVVTLDSPTQLWWQSIA